MSGGESFLVSLALALALADLRRGSLRLGTLFLDEGFGSLDEDTLDTALSVLEQLQADQNTQILIISHVGALKERIDHRIDIQKLGGGRSRLQILVLLGARASRLLFRPRSREKRGRLDRLEESGRDLVGQPDAVVGLEELRLLADHFEGGDPKDDGLRWR